MIFQQEFSMNGAKIERTTCGVGNGYYSLGVFRGAYGVLNPEWLLW